MTEVRRVVRRLGQGSQIVSRPTNSASLGQSVPETQSLHMRCLHLRTLHAAHYFEQLSQAANNATDKLANPLTQLF